MTSRSLPPHEQMMKFIVGKWISKPIYAAAELGIADHLSGGPMSIDDLAEACGARAPVLYRVMRALAGAGIFEELDDGMFTLTPMAGLLRQDALGPIARMFNSPWNDRAWMSFLEGIRTGKVPFEIAHGADISRWLGEHPEEARTLMEANSIKTAAASRSIMGAYDFSDVSGVVDVGGGDGTLLLELLENYPGMKGTIAEIDPVAAEAGRKISARCMEGRCDVVECDFFERVPEGGDLYILSNILHDWDDARCRTILRRCREAAGPDSRMLIVENVVPAGSGWSVAALLDLEMFVINGGMERTEQEYRELLGREGFGISKIVPTGGGISLIEAFPA